MKIPAQRYRSPLEPWLSERPDVEAAKAMGWREQHILVVAEDDDRLDFVERELIRRIGNRLYGGRHHG